MSSSHQCITLKMRVRVNVTANGRARPNYTSSPISSFFFFSTYPDSGIKFEKPRLA